MTKSILMALMLATTAASAATWEDTLRDMKEAQHDRDTALVTAALSLIAPELCHTGESSEAQKKGFRKILFQYAFIGEKGGDFADAVGDLTDRFKQHPEEVPAMCKTYENVVVPTLEKLGRQ
jgi:hypothetical protein